MEKITYAEYLDLTRNPDTADEILLYYSLVERGEGGFELVLKPDPSKVALSAEDIEFENAMKIGNSVFRYRRQAKFRRRKNRGENLPVLVSEGDSWFQFPLLVSEVIDQLYDDYLIWSAGAAGDTARNMVNGRKRRGETEYMRELARWKDDVVGFLFSAAGNDIIGQDVVTQEPVLFNILKPFNGDVTDVAGHINQTLLAEKMAFLRAAYTTVIEEIRAHLDFAELPIFIHGYDYAFPYPWGEDDPRRPIYAARNEWLGEPLDRRNIHDPQLRYDILKQLIDGLYDLLFELADDSTKTGVWVIDCRGAMPDVSDWIDEIHGTSQGFQNVAARFRAKLDEVLN